MEKFYQTISSKIFNEFDPYMRRWPSCIVVYYIIQYFKCKKILEVGFYEGQTFGIMLEASPPDSHLVALDPIFRYQVYNKYFKNNKNFESKQIELLETTFEEFDRQEYYDFIDIDSGMGEIDRLDHLIKSLKFLHDDSILMFDNYDEQIMDKTVDKFLNLQSDFVPFLMDPQALYFHKKTHDSTDFLDNFLPKMLATQFSLYNENYKTFNVKKAEFFLVNIEEFSSCLPDILKIRNI
jgi:hypothetical protein